MSKLLSGFQQRPIDDDVVQYNYMLSEPAERTAANDRKSEANRFPKENDKQAI